MNADNFTLSRRQFDMLSSLAMKKDFHEPDKSIMNKLISLGCVSGSNITPQGMTALEPYRAKRAVFIVAGFVTITLNTPKPLIFNTILNLNPE